MAQRVTQRSASPATTQSVVQVQTHLAPLRQRLRRQVPQRLPLGKKLRVAPASGPAGTAGPEQDLDDHNSDR